MNELTTVPTSQLPLTFRVGTMDDVPFMDELQKQHAKALGRFPFAQYEGYVQMGAVLVAESGNERVGYIISRDRYMKRDELGVIFQLCVKPGAQRKFVGAALVHEAFRRSAYGCRLYCLWCAQDLEANYFWESLGFVPLAFRAGSDKKKRVHIFWQKRIVEGDVETKWWFPSKTENGALRADRIVFPIPHGTHWKDVEAVVIPTDEANPAALPPDAVRASRPRLPGRVAVGTPAPRGGIRPMGGFRFQSEIKPEPKSPKEKKPKAPPAKIDPKYVKAARELRDRYLEHVNRNDALLPAGKYDVTRALPPAPEPVKLLAA
jgi:hypothetical protein